jgi:hypothetical protein
VFPESGLGEREGEGLGRFATERKGGVGRIEDGEEMEDEGGERLGKGEEQFMCCG